MRDLDAIKTVFKNLINNNSLSLAIWACDRTMLLISDLIHEIISDGTLMLNSDAVIGIGWKEFVLHYQPIVRLSDGIIVGYEALVRWDNPVEGFLVPGQFLDKLSQQTLLLLTLEVAAIACKQLKNLPEEIWVAINLSPYDISNRGFLNRFNAVVKDHAIAPERLRLEITENTILSEPWMTQVLHSLKAQGFTLELDDFGTGHATLAAISAYPISVIKVDKSLLDGIPGNKAKEKIFRLVIGMADALNYDIIAEGIETEAQATWLSCNGCPYGQGYLFGKPQAM
jgi:EAL domain-containing protein (putative c-di-GMP-specific phosphodiesterase class I)